MTINDVDAAVILAISREFKIDPISLGMGTELSEFRLSKPQRERLFSVIEDLFGVGISREKRRQVRTIGHICDLLYNSLDRPPLKATEIPSQEVEITNRPPYQSAAVIDFSDSYWRSALNSDGRTWPFAHIFPCVPGFQDERRDTKIAKARLKYAPYDLALERPLVIADTAGSLGGGDMLITSHRLYCKGHVSISLADSREFKILKLWNTNAHLRFPDGSSQISGELDSAVMADFLHRLLRRDLVVNPDAIRSLVHPSLGNALVEQLERMGASYTTQLAVSRVANPHERVVSRFKDLVLTDRRVVGLQSGEGALLDQPFRLTISSRLVTPRLTPVRSHSNSAHPLLSLTFGVWAALYNYKQKKDNPPFVQYSYSFESGVRTLTAGDISRYQLNDLATFSTAAEELGVKVSWVPNRETVLGHE